MSASRWTQIARTVAAGAGCMVLLAVLASPAQAQQRRSARAQVSATIFRGNPVQRSVVESAMHRLEAQTPAPDGQPLLQVTAVYLAQGARLVSERTVRIPEAHLEQANAQTAQVDRVVTLEYVAN
jgi:hypothetical protein